MQEDRIIRPAEAALGQVSITAGGERLLRLPEVTARLGVSRATVYAWIALGKFPAPIKLGKSSCWPWSVVRQVMESGVNLEG